MRRFKCKEIAEDRIGIKDVETLDASARAKMLKSINGKLRWKSVKKFHAMDGL